MNTQGEEVTAAGFCTHWSVFSLTRERPHHPSGSPGEGFTIPMAEALGVLGRAMSMSAIHIHLGRHSLKTAVAPHITDSLQLQKVLIDHFISIFWEPSAKIIGQFIDWQLCFFLCFICTYINILCIYNIMLYYIQKGFIIYNNFTCSLKLYIAYIMYMLLYICIWGGTSAGRDQIRKRS